MGVERREGGEGRGGEDNIHCASTRLWVLAAAK